MALTTVSRCNANNLPIVRLERPWACSTAIVCFWGMLISFAIVDSTGGKTPSVRLANPLAPLADFQAPLAGRFWVPADNK
jgi:hypothetical protein